MAPAIHRGSTAASETTRHGSTARRSDNQRTFVSGNSGGKAHQQGLVAGAAAAANNRRRNVGLVLDFQRRTNVVDDVDAGATDAATRKKAEAVEAAISRAAETAPINVRIGVHGGMVNVGNMGCIQRLSYTCLGDAVNTASRLESFVKQMQGPCEVLCGGCVIDEAHPAILARYVGPVRLAGKNDAIAVYQPLDVAVLDLGDVIVRNKIAATAPPPAQQLGPNSSNATPDPTPRRAEKATPRVAERNSGDAVEAALAAYLECSVYASHMGLSIDQLRAAVQHADAAADVAPSGARLGSGVFVVTATPTGFESTGDAGMTAAAETTVARPAVLGAVIAAEDATAASIQRPCNARVLAAMDLLNARIRAAHAAAAACHPQDVCIRPKKQQTAGSPTIVVDANPLHSAMLIGALNAGQPGVLEAIDAVAVAYQRLPGRFRAMFGVEDSLMCLRSGTGAIECDAK
jgi:hypothetical protein